MSETSSFDAFPAVILPSDTAPAGTLQCPRTLPPTAWDLAAKNAAPDLAKGGFGRLGALVTIDNAGRVTAHYAFSSHAERERTVPGPGKARTDWPRLNRTDVPVLCFTDAAGNSFTLAELLTELFAPFPDKNPLQGGAEQELRRALWRFTTLASATSPLVRLVAALNRTRAENSTHASRIISMTEWWVGTSPAHDIRFNGTFYGPEKSAVYLLERLLKGGERLPDPLPRWDPAVPVTPQILYEDRDLIVVNKPSRLASVPGIREKVSAKSVLEETVGALHVVHRLDADTSGVLLFAKNKEALAVINEDFRARRVHKRYAALLEGDVAEGSGSVALPLALNVFDRPRQCVLPVAAGGSEALTRFEVVRRISGKERTCTLINLFPETGRTHQLRIHCAHHLGLNAPIAGDPFYSHAGLKAEAPGVRLCLHAAELTFIHPITKKTICIVSDPPFGYD